MRYRVNATITVSLSTTVEAGSEAEAKEIAEGR